MWRSASCESPPWERSLQCVHLIRSATPEQFRRKWAQFELATSYLSLTPFDRHLAWREATQDEDWHEWPVPITHFCSDPYYIGQDVVLRPMIREFLTDFWEPANGYQVFVFVAGVGAGKSFSASISLVYGIYVLSCLREPSRYLSGFPGVSLSADAPIVFMNASAAGANQAGKIVYGEAFQRIQKSPYFRQHFPPFPNKASELDFPNRIRLSPGSSQARSAIGWNVFGFVVDEAAFGSGSGSPDPERIDSVKALFSELDMRRRSRFGTLGFGGLFTSPGSEYAFVEVMAGDDGGVHTMVRRTTTWDAQDQVVPGAEVFLFDQHPDELKVLESGLIYVSDGIAQNLDGSEVRWDSVDKQEQVTT